LRRRFGLLIELGEQKKYRALRRRWQVSSLLTWLEGGSFCDFPVVGRCLVARELSEQRNFRRMLEAADFERRIADNLPMRLFPGVTLKVALAIETEALTIQTT
jgi:hypothetical protein